MEQVEPAPNAVRVLILLFVINLVNFFDRAIHQLSLSRFVKSGA